jgi:hypothetical protein
MEAYRRLTVPELRQEIRARGLQFGGARLKEDLTNILLRDDANRRVGATTPIQPTTYQNVEPIRPVMEPNPVPIRMRIPAGFPAGANVPIPRMRNLDDDLMDEELPIEKQEPPFSLAPLPIIDTIRNKLKGTKFSPFDTIKYEDPHRTARADITWGQPMGLIFGSFYAGVFRDNKTSTINPLGYGMMLGNIDHVAALLTSLGFTNVTLTIDACYNLLWYFNIIKYPKNRAQLLTKSETEHISGFTEEQLLELLGPRYNGPRDKASLLFAATTGYSVHNPGPEAIDRYAEVSRYPSVNAWIIARNLYKIIDSDHRIISPYGPYVHIALQQSSPIERIMARVIPENVQEMIRRYGMTYNLATIAQTNLEMFEYFMAMIADYKFVLTRGVVAPVPILPLDELEEDEMAQALNEYTIDEIANVYEPDGIWNNRKSFIRAIERSYSAEPKWSWRRRHCNNDQMFNVIEGELRGAIDKNDPNNPTVSYGTLGNYTCYQITELEASFREDNNGIFQFFNPDWRPVNNAIDKRTGQPVEKVFSVASMRELRDLLNDRMDNSPSIRALHDKIVRGIATLATTTAIARRLRDEYNRMRPPEQGTVNIYLAWLFLYGMWLRFWKGPGKPWPIQWMGGGGGTDRCTTGTRDSHAVIQQGVGYLILQTADRSPNLRQWVNDLPLINYDFRTGDARMATGGVATIKEILDLVAQGRFCLANASDLVLRAAYFLIISILDIRTEEAFNQFLSQNLTELLALEHQVVERRLLPANRKNERDEDLQTLLNRRTALRLPTPILPDLALRELEGTRHIDPDIGGRLRFEQ